jgi:ribosomal protein S18 acetylase RimI-like enzyme
MRIRPYRAADDAALMAIEYRSPRGASDPFVHYRRRFADRAALFADCQLFVLEIDGRVAGCAAVALKSTQVNREPVTLGYIFDLRVDVDLRRQGLGKLLVRHVEEYAFSRGAIGMYGLVVSVNLASLRLFEQQGYTRIRQALYLEYPPQALDTPTVMPIDCDNANDLIRFTPIADRDFYVDDLADRVADKDYVRWFHDSNFGYASLSTFDQSRVYRQIALDDLGLPDEILRQRARSLRLFHPIGAQESPDLMQMVFDTVRDQALVNGCYSLSFVTDAEETLPGFFFAAAEHQKRYWLTFHSLHPDLDLHWGSPFYIDAREI